MKVEYPGYDGKKEGVFLSRVAMIQVEGYGILRAVTTPPVVAPNPRVPRIYTLADLPEPENTREQYTLARAIFVSRNAL